MSMCETNCSAIAKVGAEREPVPSPVECRLQGALSEPERSFEIAPARSIRSNLIEAELAMYDLTGKVALITGGTRGIGRAISLKLARMGATLALNYHQNEQRAQQTWEEVRAISSGSILAKADLEDEEQARGLVRRTAAELGRLDILIINAVATTTKPLLEVKSRSFWRTMAMNLGGFLYTAQEAAPIMADYGRIVVISGMSTHATGPATQVLGVAKAAMENMAKQLAITLGPRGITVNVLGLGLYDTESSRYAFGERFDEVRKGLEERAPLRRIGSNDDAAGMVGAICSPEASYLTGQIIVLDGGITKVLAFQG
jgi:NAD(P)-dependent dehydrogenase (short-subunit alcohol dehydrogenase family)